MVRESQCRSVSSAQLVANAALSLLNLGCYLVNRQIAAQEKAFLKKAVSRKERATLGTRIPIILQPHRGCAVPRIRPWTQPRWG